MRSSLAALHNLDLHYHVAVPPSDPQQESTGQTAAADLADSSVSNLPAKATPSHCKKTWLQLCSASLAML